MLLLLLLLLLLLGLALLLSSQTTKGGHTTTTTSTGMEKSDYYDIFVSLSIVLWLQFVTYSAPNVRPEPAAEPP